MLSIKYNAPAVEEVREIPAADLMDASLEGNLESYGNSEEFTW